MFILPSDLVLYFPDDSIDLISLKLARAKSLIESYLVANRKFEIKDYVEVFPIRSTATCLLKYLPILNNSNLYPIDLKIRSNANEWTNIDSDRYTIDFELGEIVFKDLALIDNWSSIWNAPRSYQYNRARQYRGKVYSQIRINYFSGFDFSNITPGSETENFLLQVVNLINYQSDDRNNGLKSFELMEHYKVDYQPESARASAKDEKGIGNSLNDLLAYFKKYQPRILNV
jgi:hypothetical protein